MRGFNFGLSKFIMFSVKKSCVLSWVSFGIFGTFLRHVFPQKQQTELLFSRLESSENRFYHDPVSIFGSDFPNFSTVRLQTRPSAVLGTSSNSFVALYTTGSQRCRIRDNTADVPKHNFIPTNISSFSLSHHALCRDTTAIPPSNTGHWIYKMKYSCYQRSSVILGWLVYWAVVGKCAARQK